MLHIIEIVTTDDSQAEDLLLKVKGTPCEFNTTHQTKKLLDIGEYLRSGCRLVKDQIVYFNGCKYFVVHQLDTIIRIRDYLDGTIAVDIRTETLYVIDNSK